MKRRNKLFINAGIFLLALLVWLYVVTYTIVNFISNAFPILFFICIILETCLLIYFLIVKVNSKVTSKDEHKFNNKEYDSLKDKYSYYVSLVDEEVKKSKKRMDFIFTFSDYEYLYEFNNNIKKCNDMIDGKPDSFIIASCLLYALLKYPMVNAPLDISIQNLKDITFLKAQIALNCALKIISEPSTYYKSEGQWIGTVHPKVEISIPKGLIKEQSLYDRIVISLVDTLYKSTDMHEILNMSHTLHLIYLYSRNM